MALWHFCGFVLYQTEYLSHLLPNQFFSAICISGMISNYFVHGYSGMAEAVHYLNSRLHQRSANIDDPDGVSPKQFEAIIRAFEKMNVGTSIYSGNVDVTGMPETETKSDDTDNTTNVESRPISGSSPSKLVGASPNAPSVPVDGHLNGLDLFHINRPPVSHVHCIGENFDDENSYVYRSCEYKNLCYDLDQKQLAKLRKCQQDMVGKMLN